jgi:3-oxoacyl-[acyl-carrier-protein] synthase-1
MKGTAIISDSVISPIGMSSAENFVALKKGKTGVSRVEDRHLSEEIFVAAKINGLSFLDGCTKFETIAILSVQDALAKATDDIDLSTTAFILATTKGNIELLEHQPFSSDLDLHVTAKKIAARFGIAKSYVVSNACTSGVMALITAKRLLKTGKFNYTIVTGADVLSHFVVSGFRSLHALSDVLCKPFDTLRNGLNLGEAAATIILSKSGDCEFMLVGDGSSNDANHISGPSRTGEELAYAIALAVKDSSIDRNEIDFVSAHGTATPYNDEMEAKAFALAGLSATPVNSLKGYFGHTLGAAGLVEVIMSIHSLKNNELISTKGFSTLGVSQPLNVVAKNESRQMKTFVKTASGFGGCNAAVVIRKNQ